MCTIKAVFTIQCCQHSSESQGGVCVRMRGAAAGELAGAVRGALRDRARARLSRSQPELTSACLNAGDISILD